MAPPRRQPRATSLLGPTAPCKRVVPLVALVSAGWPYERAKPKRGRLRECDPRQAFQKSGSCGVRGWSLASRTCRKYGDQTVSKQRKERSTFDTNCPNDQPPSNLFSPLNPFPPFVIVQPTLSAWHFALSATPPAVPPIVCRLSCVDYDDACPVPDTKRSRRIVPPSYMFFASPS